MKGHTKNKRKSLTTISDWRSTWAAGTFSSTSFTFLHEENRKHRSPDILLLCSKWARMKLIFISIGNIFEGWNVIPGKNGLEKRECSSAVRGKAHPKNKAKIQIGFNYDSMWLHRVWTKGLHIAGNMWRQIWYLRCEGKGFLSDMQLVWTNSFSILHVSFQIKALSGCMLWSRIAGSYGDCSHEIKRCLLLGRKAVTNLGSILKSRDITLLTKVHLVRAMVFPVVMYGCESWTIQ